MREMNKTMASSEAAKGDEYVLNRDWRAAARSVLASRLAVSLVRKSRLTRNTD